MARGEADRSKETIENSFLKTLREWVEWSLCPNLLACEIVQRVPMAQRQFSYNRIDHASNYEFRKRRKLLA
jgi:hypothetical protein